MRLTIEKDPEAIKRYGQHGPGRVWRGTCGALCPGTRRRCTLVRRHRGPHVAHSLLGRVLAVWDGGTEVRRSGDSVRRAVVATSRGGVWLPTLLRRLLPSASSAGDLALLVLFLGFVAFALDWFFRIL